MAKTIYFSAPAGLTLAAAAHATPAGSGTAATSVSAQTVASVYAASFDNAVSGTQLIRVTRSGVDFDLLVVTMPAADGSAWAVPRVWVDALSTAAVAQIPTSEGGGSTAAEIRTELLTLFQAICRSNATAPDDLGGTFNPATDSLEALQSQFATRYAAEVPARSTSRLALTYYINEEIEQTITLPDDSLDGETLRLVIDEGVGADRVDLDAQDVDVAGSTVTFTNAVAVTSRDRTARWALRGLTADGRKVHFQGSVYVRIAARET